MKVVVDDKIPYIQGRVERLADEVVYLPGSSICPDDVRDADALIVRTRTCCDRHLLEGSRVRFIATATIGYDHFDTKYLDEAGILWTNCPGCNATSVAQYVRNALLEAEREGLICLRESTLGIIGFGHVGTAVFEAMRPYVKRILLNDPYKFGGEWREESGEKRVESGERNVFENQEEEQFSIHHSPSTIHQVNVSSLHSPLSTLHNSCDIITLHTPLTFDGHYPTYHLIDERFLQSVQRKPILINAARGGVVDEQALERALDDGRIRAAIIDTWEGEPHINSKLLEKSFIGTPHIAGYSADGKANATRMALEALAQWMKDEGLRVKDEIKEFRIQPPPTEAERTGLCYSPTEDSERLKADPSGFEYQRGHYPPRRE